MSLPLLFLYLMLNKFRILIHPSSGACYLFVVISWVVLLWFDVCLCYVVIWLGWSGIRMQAEALGTSASACIRIPHQHNQTTTQQQHTSNQINTIHEITQQISSKLLMMDVLTSEAC